MSLDYNPRSCRPDLAFGTDERQQWWDGIDDYQFQAIVFNTIPVGISHIKDEATATKFYHRVWMYYLAKGWHDGPMYDLAFVMDLIGLSTNASTLTDPAFGSRCRQALAETATQKIAAETKATNDFQ